MEVKSKKKVWFVNDVEDIVAKTPSLRNLIDKLWLKRPESHVPEDVIRRLNEKAFKACREDDSHTKNLSNSMI